MAQLQRAGGIYEQVLAVTGFDRFFDQYFGCALVSAAVWPLRVAVLRRLQQCLTPETTVTATAGATPGHCQLLKEPHTGRQHWLQLR